MTVTTEIKGREVLISVQRSVRILAQPRGRKELHRGVIDAGRKTKTKVQRAVFRQMGLKSGRYQSGVAAHTRGVPREKNLSFEIFSVRKGQPIEDYKGLRSLASGGRAAKTMNAGRFPDDRGTVKSSVWNVSRVFKRSFATPKGFYAMRPASAGASKVAPRALWTYGTFDNTQPRDGRGRFKSRGKLYGKVRTLYGPALRDELGRGQSLNEFLSFAPGELEAQVTKRLQKIMRY